LQQNSLIYEKCCPYENQMQESRPVNVTSTLHWGNKYEPVTIMLYEKKNNTKVGVFGCIIHPTYSFLGASPDGINIDKSSNLYGRMIEVKNIVNRDITENPKEEYWIQMQIQMETCNLDECDFIETRFKEYENEEKFYENETDSEYRGVILYFINKVSDFSNISNTPHYEYMPLDIPIEKEEIDKWIKNKKNELKNEYSLYETIYWYLDEYSCLYVKRNKKWFNASIGKISEIWKTIEKERVEGYEHRNVKKKVIKPEVTHDNETTSQYIKNLPQLSNICLIKLDENGDVL